jgi:hypothetical protein
MRDVERRIRELEHQRGRLPRTTPTTPVYVVYREGEPRPDVKGPTYRLVPATGEARP